MLTRDCLTKHSQTALQLKHGTEGDLITKKFKRMLQYFFLHYVEYVDDRLAKLLVILTPKLAGAFNSHDGKHGIRVLDFFNETPQILIMKSAILSYLSNDSVPRNRFFLIA